MHKDTRRACNSCALNHACLFWCRLMQIIFIDILLTKRCKHHVHFPLFYSLHYVSNCTILLHNICFRAVNMQLNQQLTMSRIDLLTYSYVHSY